MDEASEMVFKSSGSWQMKKAAEILEKNAGTGKEYRRTPPKTEAILMQ